MAVLGKRKAPEPSVSDLDAQEIFRRHFEARFNPLPADQRHGPSFCGDDYDSGSGSDDDGDDDDDVDDDDVNGREGAEDSDSEQDSEWGGLSNDGADSPDSEDEAPAIEVVDHSVSQAPKPTSMSKRELKAFMSSRPPDALASAKSSSASATTPSSSSSSSSSTALPEDAPSLLAQDLELRRLLAESHLFRPSRASSSSSLSEPKAFASGRIRQKTTDMRIQALGSKASILKQDKMPMHMRKGINAAATAREAKRRREARENGIILEREAGGKGGKNRKARGGSGRGGLDVGRPGVGRMKGAELRISESDVRRIEGARDTFGRKGRR